MSKSKTNKDQQRLIRRRVDEIRPLLDAPHTFTHKDVDGDVWQLCRFLHMNGALEKLGKVYVDNGNNDTNYVSKWRWKENYRNYLKQYLEQREDLPCGHRKHIYNSRKVDGFSCKFCAEDGDYPEYTEEQVR